MEIARHDADDFKRLVVQIHAPPDHTGVAAEYRLPQLVAQQQRSGGAFAVLGGGEQTPHRRLDAQQRKQIGGDGRPFEPLRVALSHQVHRSIPESAHALEGLAHVFPVDVIGGRQLHLRVAGLLLPELYQAVRREKRQRPDEHEIGYRECRRVCADTQRQHQNRGERESGRAGQGARRVTEILPENVPVHSRGIEKNLEDGCDPQNGHRRRARGVAPASRPDGAHIVAVLRAEGRRIEPQKQIVEADHAVPAANPRSRAILTSSVSRRASARATAAPNGVIR